MGRTGKMWGYEQLEVEPDVFTNPNPNPNPNPDPNPNPNPNPAPNQVDEYEAEISQLDEEIEELPGLRRQLSSAQVRVRA